MKYVRTREHHYGTFHPNFPKFTVGARVKVVLGKYDREFEAEVCGPIRRSEIGSGKMVYAWSVLVRVEGEKELREIDPQRVTSVLFTPPIPKKRKVAP